jgi:hypothetical protein
MNQNKMNYLKIFKNKNNYHLIITLKAFNQLFMINKHKFFVFIINHKCRFFLYVLFLTKSIY